jgi:membrane-associated phospholipid phosphatase
MPTSAPAEQQAGEPDRPITHLFQNLLRDTIRLPSVGSAVILASGTGGALAVRPSDDNLRDWAAEQGPSGSTRFGRALGDGWVQGGAALATYGVGLVVKDRETIHVGSDLIRAQTLNAVLTRATKAVVGRQRPGGSNDSLPSGHASATFATAAVLAGHYGWEVGAPAYAVATYVGWTRVRDQAHWATDVVVGATVGLIAGYTVTRDHGARKWVVIPSASRQSASITILRRGSPRPSRPQRANILSSIDTAPQATMPQRMSTTATVGP